MLNGLLRVSNIDCYVTGSNSKFLSSDIITEFRGRGDEIRIHPLSFKEFYSAFQGEKSKAYDEYSLYGGMPELINRKTHEEKRDGIEDINSKLQILDKLLETSFFNITS